MANFAKTTRKVSLKVPYNIIGGKLGGLKNIEYEWRKY
jgi:hypothetical protein